MTRVDMRQNIESAFCASISTVVCGTAALVAAKGLQKGWSGACWAYSQGWSAPGQIAAQGRELSQIVVSKGKEAFLDMGAFLKSKGVALPILTGASTAVSFRWSHLAVKAGLPLRGKESAIENRIIAITAGVFVGSFLGLQGFRNTFQMSQISVFAHATLSAVVSIAMVTLVDSFKKPSRVPGLLETPRNFLECFKSRLGSHSLFHEQLRQEMRYKSNSVPEDDVWEDACRFGFAAGGVIAVIIAPRMIMVAAKAVNWMQPDSIISRVFKAVHRMAPSTRGIFPATFIMASTYGAIAPFAWNKRKSLPAEDSWNKYMWILVPYIAMGILGTTLTPPLSSVLLKDRVGYLPSAIIGLGGTLGTAYFDKYVKHSF